MTQPSPSADAETQLILRAIKGDAKSFGVLYDRYLNIVFNYVYYRIGTIRDTEILTEKIFLKVYEKLSHFPKEEKSQHFVAWILRLASQEIKQYAKKHRGQKQPILDDLLDSEQEAMLNALRSMSDQEYRFIVSRFFNGLNSREAAKIVGVQASELNLVQLKALQALENQMKKEGHHG